MSKLEELYKLEDYRDNRRRPPGQKRAYEPKTLWQKHHEIVGLAALGHSHKDIAKMLGVTPTVVSYTVNGELGKAKVEEVREARDNGYKDIRNRINALTTEALKVYKKIFDSPDDIVDIKMKKATADTVMLELSGHRAAQKVQSHNIHTTLTRKEIDEFRERGIAASREAGMVVDVDYETKDEDDSEGETE